MLSVLGQNLIKENLIRVVYSNYAKQSHLILNFNEKLCNKVFTIGYYTLHKQRLKPTQIELM